MKQQAVTVVGAGLAGSEGFSQIAACGCRAFDRNEAAKRTEAHQSDQFAELVCSNSFVPPAWKRGRPVERRVEAVAPALIAAADRHQVPVFG